MHGKIKDNYALVDKKPLFSKSLTAVNGNLNKPLQKRKGRPQTKSNMPAFLNHAFVRALLIYLIAVFYIYKGKWPNSRLYGKRDKITVNFPFSLKVDVVLKLEKIQLPGSAATLNKFYELA